MDGVAMDGGVSTNDWSGTAPAAWLHAPPSASGQVPESVADDSPQAHTDLPPMVLLVEDNYINQVVALEFLALLGLRARLAKNGAEALVACAEVAPDLVLMDIQMPVMDGLECARRLREQQASGQLPDFPILALTAHALDADVAASMAAGMNEHLTKPLDFGNLRERLQRWLPLPKAN